MSYNIRIKGWQGLKRKRCSSVWYKSINNNVSTGYATIATANLIRFITVSILYYTVVIAGILTVISIILN